MPADDFNRTNGGLGSTWTTVGSWAGLEIVSSQVVPTTAGSENAAYYNAWTPGSADQYAQVRVTGYGNGGPGVRVVPAGPSGYFATANQFSSALYKILAGVYTQLGASGPGLQSSGGLGLFLRVEAQGSTIRMLYDGVVLVEETDTSLTDAGAGGWLYDYNNATGAYDDWSADILGAVSVPASLVIAPTGYV